MSEMLIWTYFSQQFHGPILAANMSILGVLKLLIIHTQVAMQMEIALLFVSIIH